MRILVAVATLVVLGDASFLLPLKAQERLELFASTPQGGSVVEEVDIGRSKFGEVRSVTRLPTRPWSEQWVALAGARYLVAPVAPSNSAWSALVVFDRRSRRVLGNVALPFRPFRLTADPVSPRVFFHNSYESFPSRLAVFDASTLTTRELQGAYSGAAAMAYAPTPDLLFVQNTSFGVPHESISAYNVATGVRQYGLRSNASIEHMVVDALGQRLYVVGNLVGGDPYSPRGVLLYDAVSGAELARAPIDAHGFALDEVRGWLLINHKGRLVVLDARTLAVLQDVQIDPGPQPRLFRSFNPIVGQGLTGAYLLRSTLGLPSPQTTICYELNLEVFDLDGSRRATADLLAPLGPLTRCLDSLVVLRSPPPPHQLAAQVDGRRVTVTWDNPGDVSEFQIEVGFSPGETLLTQRLGLQTSIAVDNVPAGIYYLRVKATNEVGTSRASNEIRIDLP